MDPRKQQGAFDVGTVVAELVGLLGVVLVVVGVLDAAAEAPAGTDGPDLDLWAGLALVAVALAVAGWTRRRRR
ncbi:hypothetical protein [Blastococcus sp. SYSU DS0539]